MELVFIVLNKPEFLEEILSRFVDKEIKGATVVDSSGMGHLVANQFPMFSMFAELGDSKIENSKTIFTVVQSPEERQEVLTSVESVLGDISNPDTAVFFSTPVSFQKGII